MPHRVVVIEDSPRFRKTLEQLFHHAPDFELAGSYGMPPPALRDVERSIAQGAPPGWEIVVMDLEMPEMDGIEATRRLKALLPRVKIVALTVFEQPETILQAIGAGADGYLLKKARARELLDGLKMVVEGGAPLTPAVASSLLDVVRQTSAQERRPATPPSRLDLTEREQDVLRGLVAGQSYKEVASALGISLGTVRSHISSVYRKLRVHNVAEAVTRAIRDRLV